MITRRNFLTGTVALAASYEARALESLSAKTTEKPKLRLGVISDIHVDAPKGDFMIFGDTTTFESTLRYFRERAVDGVVITGDMADCGMRNQLACVAEAWERIFPNNRGASGERVEKLFIFGNHDMEGCNNWGFNKRYEHKDSFFREVIATDPKKAWEDIFHEPYAPIWTKEVKGYRFVGAHWVPGQKHGILGIEEWFSKHGNEIDPKLPFFYLQHQHPKGTCHLENAWGADNGLATKVLSRFPNAVAFSGHSHIPLTDPAAIWQGAFTSVGCGSLRFAGGMFPLASVGPEGYENTRKNSLMPNYEGVWESRQGMVLSVYDDRLVFERRDFMHEAEKVGDDWVMPLGADAPQPFAPDRNLLVMSAPEFAVGARAEVREASGVVTFTFPAAIALKGARTYDWELLAINRGREVFVKRMVDYNCRRGIQHACGPVTFPVLKTCFPIGESEVYIRPRGYNGRKGRPIVAKVRI